MLAGLAFCELALACPAAGWLYLVVVVLLAAGLVRPASLWRQLPRLGTFVALSAVGAVLHFGEWTTRKPFLRDLDRVRPGMMEGEVREVMARYLEGTGWPAVQSTTPNEPGTLQDLGGSLRHATAASPSGQLALKDSLVFRHSTSRAFNSDWGIVTFTNGRVAQVSFSPD